MGLRYGRCICYFFTYIFAQGFPVYTFFGGKILENMLHETNFHVSYPCLIFSNDQPWDLPKKMRRFAMRNSAAGKLSLWPAACVSAALAERQRRRNGQNAGGYHRKQPSKEELGCNMKDFCNSLKFKDLWNIFH